MAAEESPSGAAPADSGSAEDLLRSSRTSATCDDVVLSSADVDISVVEAAVANEMESVPMPPISKGAAPARRRAAPAAGGLSLCLGDCFSAGGHRPAVTALGGKASWEKNVEEDFVVNLGEGTKVPAELRLRKQPEPRERGAIKGMVSAKISFVRRLKPDERLLSLIFVYFTVFIDILGLAQLVPVLPSLVGAKPHAEGFSMEQMNGLSPGLAASAVMSTYTVSQLVSNLVGGPISDCFGRKVVLLAMLVGGAVGFAFQGVAIMYGSWIGFLLARCLAGLFGGSRAVAVAYIADTSPPEQRAKLMGMLALAVTFALQFGSVLGGSLGSLSLALPCYATACASGVGAALVWQFVVEAPPAADMGQSAASGGAQAHRMPLLVNIVLSFACGVWGMGKITGNALLMTMKFDFTPNDLGLMAMGDGICVLVGNPIYLFLIKRLRVPTTSMIGGVLLLFSAACPYTSSAALALGFNFVASIGAPITMPATMAIVAVVAPSKRRGAWTGFTIASQSLGRAVGPALHGIIFDIDYQLSFLVLFAAAALVIFSSALLVPHCPMAKQPKAAAAEPAREESNDISVLSSPYDSENLSEHVEALVDRLRRRRQDTQEKLELHKAGREVLPAPATQERREVAKGELSDWLVALMEAHGYTAWPEHMDGLKLMLFNAFPRLSTSSREEKLVDLIRVFEAHIGMAEKTEMFVGAEDLLNVV